MSPVLRVAVVEDHAVLCNMFVDHLANDGHAVAGFSCAEELDEHLAQSHIDLLVLDINLPGESGYSIAERLRHAHAGMAIVMLTSRTAEGERIRGYRSGADVYLPKPVSPAELSAVVDRVAHRLLAERTPSGAPVLDLSKLRLVSPAAEVDLGRSEVILLKALVEAPARRLEYWRMLELIERAPDDAGRAALELVISRLRKKLLAAGLPLPCIKAIRGEGYLLCGALRILA